MRRAAAAVSQVAHLHGRGPGVVPGLPISPRHACPAGPGAPPRTSSQPTSRHDSATTASPGPFQKPLRPHPKPPHICLAPGAAGAPAPAQGGASRSRPQRFLAEVRARPMRLGHETEAQPPSGWQAVMSIPAQSGCMPRMLSDRGSKAEVDSLRRAGLPTEMGDRMKTPKRGARCVGRTRSPARRQNDLRWQSLTAGQGGGGHPWMRIGRRMGRNHRGAIVAPSVRATMATVPARRRRPVFDVLRIPLPTPCDPLDRRRARDGPLGLSPYDRRP